MRKTNFKFLLIDLISVIFGIKIWYIICKRYHIYNIYYSIGVYIVIVAILNAILSYFVYYIYEKNNKLKIYEYIKYISKIIFLPLTIGIIANMIPVNNEQTYLTILIDYIKYGKEYPFIAKIGDIAVAPSYSTEVKYESISTLKVIHSRKSLEQLFRILNSDIIKNYSIYKALIDAIASYPNSKKQLLEIYFQSDTYKNKISFYTPPNLYNMYFGQSFNNIRDELRKNIADPNILSEQLIKIDKIETDLRILLKEIENKYIPPVDNPALEVVLDTFIKMEDVYNYDEIYALAQNIAFNTTYPTNTRVKAINLLAKYGKSKDIYLLSKLLNVDNDKILVATLKAIAYIHQKNTMK